jgi:hypothetical protein
LRSFRKPASTGLKRLLNAKTMAGKTNGLRVLLWGCKGFIEATKERGVFDPENGVLRLENTIL